MLIKHYDMLQETCTCGLKNSAVRNLKPEYAKRTRLVVFVYAIVANKQHASTYSPVAFRSVHTGIEPPFLLQIF